LLILKFLNIQMVFLINNSWTLRYTLRVYINLSNIEKILINHTKLCIKLCISTLRSFLVNFILW